ncbi:MAG: hypothetical protein M1840_004059 [Geoglossum simile]|nr:MAG: hypothetical protein M1840_004059 [Geoglossum simile]
MGKNKKRKCNTTNTASSAGDGYDRSKRPRPSTADGDCGFAGMVHPRVDPLTGQHGAFPGLDVDDPDELFYGPANDGLDYLRMVRSEAKEVPQLLVAPKEDENDDIYGSGVGDSRGFYEDGAYTAAPILGPMPPSDLGQKSPMEIYLDRLILRFKLHRANLRCIPPAGAVQALSKDHPISCEPTKASYSRWHRLLRATDPLPVQLSAMDQVAALRLIRLITQNGFLKRDKIFDSRVSRWIWGLLGRVEDVGVMGSQDVGIIRDLGKRAVWVVEGLMERKRRDAEVDVEEIESGEPDGGVEEYMDTDETKEEGGVLGGDNFEPSLGGEHTIYTPAIDSATAMPKDEELEEGEISDSPEEPTVDTAADELEAAKTRLMARVSAAEHNGTAANGANGSENAGKEGALAGGEEHWERESNVRGTLNMIITVVGELYGQRDLLKHRDLLWELAD